MAQIKDHKTGDTIFRPDRTPAEEEFSPESLNAMQDALDEFHGNEATTAVAEREDDEYDDDEDYGDVHEDEDVDDDSEIDELDDDDPDDDPLEELTREERRAAREYDWTDAELRAALRERPNRTRTALKGYVKAIRKLDAQAGQRGTRDAEADSDDTDNSDEDANPDVSDVPSVESIQSQLEEAMAADDPIEAQAKVIRDLLVDSTKQTRELASASQKERFVRSQRAYLKRVDTAIDDVDPDGRIFGSRALNSRKPSQRRREVANFGQVLMAGFEKAGLAEQVSPDQIVQWSINAIAGSKRESQTIKRVGRELRERARRRSVDPSRSRSRRAKASQIKLPTGDMVDSEALAITAKALDAYHGN
jgi:hypothetical protein